MPEWFTPRQAAKTVDRSHRTVKRWIADGMPSLRIGDRIYVREDDLFAHLRTVLEAEPESKTRWETK